ncbi:hypothetical protein BHM03_00031959 [Ensete ventricosum]|nr:hypothetical protein BHM03_00031959 [Ensete ventricosum]
MYQNHVSFPKCLQSFLYGSLRVPTLPNHKHREKEKRQGRDSGNKRKENEKGETLLSSMTAKRMPAFSMDVRKLSRVSRHAAGPIPFAQGRVRWTNEKRMGERLSTFC